MVVEFFSTQYVVERGEKMTNTALLKMKIKERGIKIGFLVEKLNTSYSWLNQKINNKITVVTSKEKPIKKKGKILASISFVPSSAGLLIASHVVHKLISEKFIS